MAEPAASGQVTRRGKLKGDKPARMSAVASGVAEALRRTSAGERIFYLVLLVAGVVLIAVGLYGDAHGWAVVHAYAVGLLLGATGFCFGTPVVSVAVREVTRRSADAAQRRVALEGLTAQLDALDIQARVLAPDQDGQKTVSDRLRQLARLAQTAKPTCRVTVGSSASMRKGQADDFTAIPYVRRNLATDLRAVVHAARPWALIGISCRSLTNDALRLRFMLDPPPKPLRSWLERLLVALQEIPAQLPGDQRWLKLATADPPETDPPWWYLPAHAPAISPDVLIPGFSETRARVAERKASTEAHYTDELRKELDELSSLLDAVAELLDASTAARRELVSLARA